MKENKVKTELTEFLRGFTTESRWEKMHEVIENRTRYLTVVMEDIYQPHNASAVLRSCDGFGIQDIHVIENRNEFTASDQVTIGADQWLSLSRYNSPETDNTSACLKALKDNGYRIVVTSPHKNDNDLNELPLDQKTALVFGTELHGVSDIAMDHADAYMKIPMFGFSESFNISVSAAICLYNTTRRLRAERKKQDWMLSDTEKIDLKIEWLKKSIKAGEELEKKFYSGTSS